MGSILKDVRQNTEHHTYNCFYDTHILANRCNYNPHCHRIAQPKPDVKENVV